jgi:hypothetical protein
MVMEHTGWTETELKVRCRQGRLLELHLPSTHEHPECSVYPAEQFVPGFDFELLRFINWVASMSCSEWATSKFLNEWQATGLLGKKINGWTVLALADTPVSQEPITDQDLKGGGKRLAPKRPLFALESPKRALVEAFEAFAAQRCLDYKMRDALEDED